MTCGYTLFYQGYPQVTSSFAHLRITNLVIIKHFYKNRLLSTFIGLHLCHACHPYWGYGEVTDANLREGNFKKDRLQFLIKKLW